jgi:hypothetical protein
MGRLSVSHVLWRMISFYSQRFSEQPYTARHAYRKHGGVTELAYQGLIGSLLSTR